MVSLVSHLPVCARWLCAARPLATQPLMDRDSWRHLCRTQDEIDCPAELWAVSRRAASNVHCALAEAQDI